MVGAERPDLAVYCFILAEDFTCPIQILAHFNGVITITNAVNDARPCVPPSDCAGLTCGNLSPPHHCSLTCSFA